MTDPTDTSELVPPMHPGEQLAAELSRSMMWDMIGPYSIRDEAFKYGQHPASDDVLEAEAEEFRARQSTLLPFGMFLPMYCTIASEAACRAVVIGQGLLEDMTPEELFNFRMNNIHFASSVAASVIGNMLQRGLLTYGDNHELLGSQA
jgi:hypothetical protein